MSVAHPWWIVAGIIAAAAFAALWRASTRRAAGDTVAYTDLAFLAAATQPRWRPDRFLAGAWIAALVALGVALAGPRIMARVPVRDATVVVCVDTSGSMSSTDVTPSRAEAASAAVATFVDAVPAGTRIGIVAFSSGAAVVAEPSADRDAVRSAITRIPPPNGGTAIGDALGSAAGLLPSRGTRAIVLVTDGVNNAGSDPLAVARQIGASGVRIETVGIGTNGSGELIPGTGELASIDEDALREIAADGHGSYTRVENAATLQHRLGALALTTTFERRPLDLAFPLAVAGGLLALGAAGAGLALGRF